jgi:hypothetical protein
VKVLKILLLALIIILLLPTVSAVDYGSFKDVDYLTPTEVDSYPTATVEKIVKVNYVKGTGKNPVLHFAIELLRSDLKTMWEDGWIVRIYKNDYDVSNQEYNVLVHEGTNRNTYGYVHKLNCGTFPNSYFYLKILTTIPASTSEPFCVNRISIYNADMSTRYGIWDFRTDIDPTVPVPNIDLDANPLEKTIDPDTTTQHPFTVTNIGKSDCTVNFEYDITFKDIYGEDLDKDGWDIDFYNSNGLAINWLKVEGETTEICYMAIHSPKAEDAPADATVKIHLTAKAVNDIDRSVTKDIGGDRLKLSDDFTGTNAGTSIWQSTLMYFGILIIIIVVVIILIFKLTAPKTKR